MKPISTTDLPNLKFNEGQKACKMKAQANKIGWIHSISDTSGAKFDLTIKDALGRVMFTRSGFGSDTVRSGELINLETHLGEEIEVIVDNIQNAKEIDLFIN